MSSCAMTEQPIDGISASKAAETLGMHEFSVAHLVIRGLLHKSQKHSPPWPGPRGNGGHGAPALEAWTLLLVEAAQVVGGCGDIARQAEHGVLALLMARCSYQESYHSTMRLCELAAACGPQYDLARPDRAATASASPTAAGVLARCCALVAPDDSAEARFQQA
jgi:hypothetical protein